MNASLSFGWPITIYFICSSIAAAWSIKLSVKRRSTKESSSLRHWIVALGAIFVGGTCLIVDLERPQDFLMILSQGNASALISWGVVILGAFSILVAGLTIHEMTNHGQELAMFPRVVLLVLSLGLAVYPGLVLYQIGNAPLWETPLSIVILTLSTLHLAMALISGATKKFERVLGVATIFGLALLTVSQPDSWIFPGLAVVALGASTIDVNRSRTIALSLFAVVVIRHWVMQSGQIS